MELATTRTLASSVNLRTQYEIGQACEDGIGHATTPLIFRTPECVFSYYYYYFILKIVHWNEESVFQWMQSWEWNCSWRRMAECRDGQHKANIKITKLSFRVPEPNTYASPCPIRMPYALPTLVDSLSYQFNKYISDGIQPFNYPIQSPIN